MYRTLGLAAAVLALAFSPACTKNNAKRLGGICADDVQKFCSDIKPGDGRIIKCLGDHANDLSPDCLATHRRRAERVAGASAAAAVTAPAAAAQKCTVDKPCADDTAKTSTPKK